jgi:CubicO group peptidase (beta-lactamase class C family)
MTWRSCLIGLTLLSVLPQGATADDQPFETWLEETVTAAMEEHRVPGVVVGVVRAGEPVLLRGFGDADIAGGIQMDPSVTVIPVASVSKVYTAAAVLELVADGRLDLDADVTQTVNGLTFRGPFDEPIKLRHLLTHTAGLDEQNLDRYLPLAEADEDQGAYLLASMPRRIRPPGRVYQYSNHGMALAGLAAEQAAATPFAQVVEERVFGPLGMARSSFRNDAPRSATGYADVDGVLVPQQPQYIRTGYSGMMVSTAEDQVSMLQALLEGSKLDPRTIETLTSRQFSHGPHSSGTAFAMFEDRWAGQEYYWHEGQTRGFYAGFYVVPEKGLGLFLAYNRHRGTLASVVRYGFLNREVGPAQRETDLAPSDAAPPDIASRIEGTYRYVRHARRTPELILSSLLGRASEIQVRGEPDDTFMIGSGRFHHAEHLQFVEAETGAVNGFIADGVDGRAEYLYYNRNALQRIPGYAREEVRDGWIGLSLILYGLTLVTWLVTSIVGRKRKWPSLTGQLLQTPAILVQLAFVIGLVAVASHFRGPGIFGLLFPWPAWIDGVFWLPWIAAVLIPVQLFGAVLVWRRRDTCLPARLHHTLVAAFGLWFLFSGWIWGLYF